MATQGVPVGSRIEFGGVSPILRVTDMAASIDYYINKLGFKVNWGYPGDGKSLFASISRGRCCLFLSVGDQGHPGTWVWIDGKHVESLYLEFVASGAKIRNPPTNYEWAMEMQIEDLDGNVLRFGSDPRKDEANGPWLDMNGDRWIKVDDGSFRKLER
ncbi:MAG TPA: glyoxalase superfamily protein [Terracidiphilus sp.]|nr:glyoxalase superfamily protein [Terracidiphilus sp.]